MVEETVKKSGDNTRKPIYTTNSGMLMQDCRRISRIEKEELMEKLTKIVKMNKGSHKATVILLIINNNMSE